MWSSIENKFFDFKNLSQSTKKTIDRIFVQMLQDQYFLEKKLMLQKKSCRCAFSTTQHSKNYDSTLLFEKIQVFAFRLRNRARDSKSLKVDEFEKLRDLYVHRVLIALQCLFMSWHCAKDETSKQLCQASRLLIRIIMKKNFSTSSNSRSASIVALLNFHAFSNNYSRWSESHFVHES